MESYLPHWLQLFSDKSPEAWIAVFAGCAYVWFKSGNTSKIGRIIEAVISGSISLALSPDIITVMGYPDSFVHFIAAVFGFMLLDVMTSIVSDKTELAEMFKSFIHKWLGTPRNDGDK